MKCHLGSWRACRRTATASSPIDELADTLVPYVERYGLHPYRAAADHRASLRRLLGLSADRPLRADRRFGTPEGFRAPRRRAATPPASASSSIGCRRTFPTMRTGWPFDGTHLYEHADPRQGFHRDWNTLIYNYGRREVANFLLGNALFWLERFHIDGLRVDAVASMLYLDYSRKRRRMGSQPLRRARESGSHRLPAPAQRAGLWPASRDRRPSPRNRPPGRWCRGRSYLGGLGFGYKWNMGWMHDTLDYMSSDPIHRTLPSRRAHLRPALCLQRELHPAALAMTRSCTARARCSARCRATAGSTSPTCAPIYGFMCAHPGKKLLFMGGEFGQEREWNHDRSLDWHLLGDPLHRGMQAPGARPQPPLSRAAGAARARLRARRLRVDRCDDADRACSPSSAPRPRPATARSWSSAISRPSSARATASACPRRAASASASTPTPPSMAAAMSAMRGSAATPVPPWPPVRSS